ncbi:probable cardiolipin synthase (CMP-forming) [Phlebotomus argentipes]|uniref:probable cardiolipin synthase (CMP-forming) n=1 Tax=Phlebotomus argentipes TaxID=94469 RepID=UPI0028930865|nr:probable cardiolipin synthase (CMP-forming) [Phlebotomus argentipes]
MLRLPRQIPHFSSLHRLWVSQHARSRPSACWFFTSVTKCSATASKPWAIANEKARKDVRFQELHKAVQGRELIQDVLEKKKEILLERKNELVQDLRDKRAKVRVKMEEVIERENIMTIPNLLCVLRGVLAPYLGYVIIQQDFTFAIGLLVAAGISDLLDGYIARNWPSQMSNFGSFLDPMADKLLMGSLVISLSYCSLLPIWLTATILFRDVFLIGAGFIIRYKSLPPPRTLTRYFDATHVTAQLAPTFVSKVNTVVQLIAVATSLGAPVWDYVDHPMLHGLWYLTGATTVAAAVSYIMAKDTYKIFRKRPGN